MHRADKITTFKRAGHNILPYRVTVLYPHIGTWFWSKRKFSLGVYANFRKVNIGFLMSICILVHTSINMEYFSSFWADCHEILCFSMFRTPIGKFQVSFQSDKENGCFTLREIYTFDHISLSTSWNNNVPKV